MRLVLLENGTPGLLTESGVVDISAVAGGLGASGGQEAMEAIISNFDAVRPELARLEQEGTATPLSEGVRAFVAWYRGYYGV